MTYKKNQFFLSSFFNLSLPSQSNKLMILEEEDLKEIKTKT